MNQYTEYAKIKAKIKTLTAKAKEMEIDIMSSLQEVEGEKLVTEHATFSLIGRTKYQYSDELTLKEKQVKEKLKLMKKAEETNGKAIKITDGQSLRCQITSKEL
jgi:ABC-type Zn uptake system ZnuABC Zn-binding protein ZnuA